MTVRGCLTLAATLVVALLALSYCSQRDAAKRVRADATVAQATGKALDRVANETPAIRQDQQEKQHEVDAIPGSSDRLPDGYGDALQRVRDREHRNP